MARITKLIARHHADENNDVVHVVTNGEGQPVYRREPCAGCPWRIRNTGNFPAQAFRISAPTCYDAAFETFACHESGQKSPATCAGFLLQNSVHNLTVRIKESKWGPFEVRRNRARLYKSYRDMAVANGVPPDDPAIAACRANNETYRKPKR